MVTSTLALYIHVFYWKNTLCLGCKTKSMDFSRLCYSRGGLSEWHKWNDWHLSYLRSGFDGAVPSCDREGESFLLHHKSLNIVYRAYNVQLMLGSWFDQNGRHFGFSLFRSRLCIKFWWNITGNWLDSAYICKYKTGFKWKFTQTYIHSLNSQGFSSEIMLLLLGAQGGDSTCPGEARVQRVKNSRAAWSLHHMLHITL
jgi:hypothetical protein